MDDDEAVTPQNLVTSFVEGVVSHRPKSRSRSPVSLLSDPSRIQTQQHGLRSDIPRMLSTPDTGRKRVEVLVPTIREVRIKQAKERVVSAALPGLPESSSSERSQRSLKRSRMSTSGDVSSQKGTLLPPLYNRLRPHSNSSRRLWAFTKTFQAPAIVCLVIIGAALSWARTRTGSRS
jgi:hypothetical protein